MAVRDAVTKQLLSAIDAMQDMAPGSTVQVRTPPESDRARQTWKLAVRFVLPKGTTYEDVFSIVRDWRDSREVERKVGADRLSRIQVRYDNLQGRGSHGEYTLAEIGSWQLVSSRATERVGIRDGKLDSLIERYGSSRGKKESYVESIIVWFSEGTKRDVKLAGRGMAPRKNSARATVPDRHTVRVAKGAKGAKVKRAKAKPKAKKKAKRKG